MDFLVHIVGVALILLALLDIYLTVLRPHIGSSLLSILIAKGTWQLFRIVARLFPKKHHRVLSHSGSTIIVVIVIVWILLLIFGFALIIWTGLGTTILSSREQTPQDFATALYYSGYSITTLGTGDLAPETGAQRLLMVLQAALGFSTFTLIITYTLSVYSALTKRNTFALTLHHRTDNTADPAELLARLAVGNNLNNTQQNISGMARDLINLSESQNTYPILLYFRFQQIYYSLPRIMYLVMDTVTLIKSAMDTERSGSLIRSAAVTELWCGGLHLLQELCRVLELKVHATVRQQNEQLWQEHYDRAVNRLRIEGIEITPDPEAGAELYISLRYQWEPYLNQLMKYMGYEKQEVFLSERWH